MKDEAVLRADRLSRRFGDFEAVCGVSLALREGASVALLGPSGCGKTTLLHMLGLLERPTGGRVSVGGIEAWKLSASQRAQLRLRMIGFIFQQGNLLSHLSARENVALPAWRRSGSRAEALRQADSWLDRLGLSQRRLAKAAELSVGEGQRVAVARALLGRPKVVLADEPTGSLDSQSAQAVLDALKESVSEHTALLLATHDPAVAAPMSVKLTMRDGRFV